ncbi:phospholipase A and acyltransferase 4-like [Oncorhynchus clarkii lewisi]|uniref:phospholipase A and acyltransferase 4-like n=1 Tax=Oncorhynchus clarkii lewisi TaxID=490388 RepID=UPI0039B84AC7
MKIGDMIEITRGTYNHWALYIGNGKVIHVVTPDGSGVLTAFSSSSPSVSCKGMIIIDTLKAVADGNPYKINNYLDNKYKPRRTDVIMEDVDILKGRTIKYGLLGRNCEHFVTFLRYGKSKSKQADDFLKNLFIASGLLGGVAVVAAVASVAVALIKVFK